MGNVGSGQDLIDGGYLKFGDIVQNDDGSFTAKLMIDRDGRAGDAAGFENLATVTLDNVQGFNPDGDVLHQLPEQLNQNRQSHFQTFISIEKSSL